MIYRRTPYFCTLRPFSWTTFIVTMAYFPLYFRETHIEKSPFLESKTHVNTTTGAMKMSRVVITGWSDSWGCIIRKWQKIQFTRSTKKWSSNGMVGLHYINKQRHNQILNPTADLELKKEAISKRRSVSFLEWCSEIVVNMFTSTILLALQ